MFSLPMMLKSHYANLCLIEYLPNTDRKLMIFHIIKCWLIQCFRATLSMDWQIRLVSDGLLTACWINDAKLLLLNAQLSCAVSMQWRE